MSAEARIHSQLNTPKEWIMNNRMFRIKTWEIEETEIRALLDKLIVHKYYLNVIRNKEKQLQHISLLFLTDDSDVEKIRTTLLVTSSGTELRKTSQLKNNNISTRTLKSTVPIWLTHARVWSIFSKYNTDTKVYDNVVVDHKVLKNVQYPLIRFYPTTVDRKGKVAKVNVVYIEFSPNPACKNDSFIALSMEHRSEIKNNISGEIETLMFDEWTVEKPTPITKKSEILVQEEKSKKVQKIY